MMLPPATGLRFLVPILLVGVLAAGCGSSGKKSSGTTASTATSTTSASSLASATVTAEVPAKYKSKTLKVAADATYAPNEFIGSNGHTVVGMDPDLAKALAGVMGVKVDVVNATFNTIIPGLSSGKY